MMMRIARLFILAILVCVGLVQISPAVPAFAQQNRVGQLRVDQAGVELQRVNTTAWVPIRIETIIGVGDSIRTLEKGRARLNFFGGVFAIDLLGSTEVKISTLVGQDTAPVANISIVQGFGKATSLRTLKKDDPSYFELTMPQMSTRLLEGQAAFRVETNGRSAILVTTKSLVVASDGKGGSGQASLNTGIRADGSALSETVPAFSFPTLDSALDGCPGNFDLTQDARINVRLGASTTFARIGGIDPRSALRLMGTAASGGWYRIQFKGGFGWIKVEKMVISTCAGLRVFSDNQGPEDFSLFQNLTEPIDANTIATPTPAPKK